MRPHADPRADRETSKDPKSRVPKRLCRSRVARSADTQQRFGTQPVVLNSVKRDAGFLLQRNHSQGNIASVSVVRPTACMYTKVVTAVLHIQRIST